MEVLPLLPLALPTWLTICCGVKDKLLKSRDEIESLDCWRQELSSASLCQQHTLLGINQDFLFVTTAFAVHFPFPGTVGASTPFCAAQLLIVMESSPAAAPGQLLSWQQPCSPGSWMSRGKAMGKYTHGCVQVLAKPTHSHGQVGASGGSGRARGGWCLYEVLDGAASQDTALMVSWLVEMKTMAEHPGASITGLACLLCRQLTALTALRAEHQISFCHAANVGGDAATCFVAVAPAACPLCCPGLQGAEDLAFLTRFLLQLEGWQRGKSQGIQG